MIVRNRMRRVLIACGGLALGSALGVARAADPSVDELLRFGVTMARDGNWREAKFRWEKALQRDPADARVMNNLAIASEALGDPERARALFESALAASEDSRIRDNASRSALFWKRAADGAASERAAPPAKKKGRDVVAVAVALPLPPRLTLDGVKTLLVSGFLVNDSELLDVNRELVRFLRAEFRKHTSYDVLDVIPIPPVPEQTLDDLAKNAAFFRWLGREHGADVIVSGAMRYTRRDASGFEDVDIVSESTGQKIKQTRFVEQEEFTFELDVLYLRGSDGSLLFRDRMSRQAFFRGAANDPISAFYELGNSIAGDVLSVIAPRTRSEQRFLFKG
ncbi:MAG TPA: tetratricopeptide repeat protein [Candidatus Polarisedimenticolaceae bacterium]|nr:tetratricopeptide repeat protein [Candidatus Polarisedimenticolaceae bacterium]